MGQGGDDGAENVGGGEVVAEGGAADVDLDGEDLDGIGRGGGEGGIIDTVCATGLCF